MEKKWGDMTLEEKREVRFATWLSAEGVTFESEEAKKSYRASITRFKDALLLEKVPDRVPIFIIGTFMQAHLYGVTPGECMYDYSKLVSAHKRFLQDYRPDFYSSPAMVGSGKVLDILDMKQYRWPGHGIPETSGYQCVEGEYMTAEDYKALIEDPSDFWLRIWFPSIFGALEPLKNLRAFTDLWEIVGVSGHMIPFGIPEVQKALKSLMAAGDEAMAWVQQISALEMEAKAMGFVGSVGGAAKAPFDILADTLRGTRGVMMDMYRQPDMILKAVERLTPLYIRQGLGMAISSGNPLVFMPLHKGADGFMSDEQFRTFYWPTLKAVILGLVEEGCVPFLFCEGGYNSRLQYLQELPKGSCFWLFDRTDMVKAKEMLGNTLCIGGNVPSSLILTGTPDEVKDYCRSLIDTAGKGGGYIMSFGSAMDEGRPENVHAMIDVTKEYGVYA